MAANGEITPEDTEMAECDGEKVVTMMDVLKQQEAFEEDVNAVLGGSDDKNCTYSKGYVKRQAVYACLTCCPEARTDPAKRAGVCLACSLNCHENHDLVELYTKRNFRCDCGNPKFSQPCQFTPNKTDLNYENRYNQNFSGLYCTCHRPYPDPDVTDEEEMIQCIICEDWLHSDHLEATVPDNDQYAEMICKDCMEDNDFLHDYSDLIVNTVDKEIIVTDPDLDVTNFIKEKMNKEKETNGIADSVEVAKEETDTTLPDSIDNNIENKSTIPEDVEMAEAKADGSGDTVTSPKKSEELTSENESKPDADAGDQEKTGNEVSQDKPETETGTQPAEITERNPADITEQKDKPEEPNKEEEPEKKEESDSTEEKITAVEPDSGTKDEANVTSDQPAENPEPKGDSITNGEDKPVSNITEDGKSQTPKRKFSADEETETLSPKKQKVEKPCIKPKGVKRVYKGSTFWPSTLRQKLCTCGECLSMYKDLAVLFLIDMDDTVTAYETLGKEQTDGNPTPYEQGLQALSSLDRVQQINALTEYNKMRDKLLDYLKSFKERKEIVKEEDIKAFFAEMKPKREPDGVYFCR